MIYGMQKERKKKVYSLKTDNKKFTVMPLLFFMIGIQLCFLSKEQVMAASGLRIYNYTTKKEYTYTDAQIKVTYNGKQISKDSTPGILQNGYALVSYKDIFANSPINADCVYDKAAGTVSISKYGTTIVLKIGSTEAYINGKKVTAPVAPVKIKYVKEDVTKILVPSRFVSENLGFKYTWKKEISTVAIERDSFPMLLSYNDGEPFYYTGTQGKVTIDGKAVDLGNMPSVITNNTAMLRAKRVFADSAIKAKYKYNSKDKTITLTRNGNVLEMKIGSSVAYLNGNPFILDTAPMIVTNHDVETSYVMVPGSVTATCLGFDYRWDKNTGTSVITSRKDSQTEKPQETIPNNNNDQKEEAPELGDSPVTWDAGKIHYQWETPKELIRSGTGVQTIDNGSQADESGVIYSVSRIYDNKMYVNSETYAIYSTAPFTKVTSNAKGNQIQLDISNMYTSDYTYSMSEISDGILNTVHTYMADTKNSRLDFKLNTDKFTYDLAYSSEYNNILYLTIYYDYLNKVVIGTNDTMDYITLTCNFPINPVINNFYTTITVDLPGIKKGFGDQFVNITDAINLYYTSVYYTSDGTHLILGLKNSADYYIAEEGNSFTIMLPKDKNTIPVVPKEPDPGKNDPVVPENPVSGADQYQLIIPNPSGLKISQIEHEDQYYNLRFSIKLPGDYVSYFSKNPIKVNSGVIKDVSVILNSKNKTEILVTTSKIQGYKLYADKNYIYVKVANPKDIYKNIVVLDPGHGGSQPGAYYFNTYEKTLNFKILYEIGKQFFESDPDKLKVYYTRISDVDVSLGDRAAFAEKVGADLFVSLHMNASTSKSVYGTEVYYSASNNKPNKAGLTSEILAKLFANNITYALKTHNRGIRAEKYTVVHKNTVPAVLIELGFMSNQNEFKKLSDPDFQYLAAKTIYETLLQVFELYPTGR